MTPWLKLMGKGAPNPPIVHIFLKRRGEVLKKAKAEVGINPTSCEHCRGQVSEVHLSVKK